MQPHPDMLNGLRQFECDSIMWKVHVPSPTVSQSIFQKEENGGSWWIDRRPNLRNTPELSREKRGLRDGEPGAGRYSAGVL